VNINYSDELIRLLEEIETKIEYLENSSNLAFELIEYDTIKTFHNYNLCFKNFKITFNHSSASQLLLFIKVVNTHFELSKRYEKLFRKQLSELLKILDIEHDCVITLSPVIFCEDRNSDVLDAYKRFCKHNTDERGKPLYDIVLDRDYHSEEIDGKEVPVNFYRFRSDNLNKYLCDIFFSLYKSLLYMFDLVCAVCTYPSALISDEVLDKEELLCSLENELRQYAKEVGSNVERDLRKIAQNLKSSRSSPLTSEVWGKVMDEEDKLFDLAINGCLGETEEKQLEHISATKEQLIDNYSLLQKIKSTCLDEELFDIRLSVETHNLLLSLNADNLELFYELVLRRNIIQREMFPDKLKAQYEEWLSQTEEQQLDEDTELTAARQSKLNEIIGIFKNGNWKTPATADNIELLMNVIFGKDKSLLEEGDVDNCENMWALIEGGSGDRMVIMPANLAGYFAEENLLAGSPKVISNALFGNGNQVNNINKGNSNRCSAAFTVIIPFLKKYIDKIIRQI